MTAKERDRLKVIEQVDSGWIGTAQAAERLGVSQRQTQRLVAGYRERGDVSLVHGLRGRRPNNTIAGAVRRRAVELIGERYADYGPTLAAEVLAQEAAIFVSRQTARRWMVAAGLWKGARRGRRHRLRRPRRRCLGELVQMDTSEHDWLEGRGPALALVTMIDDATNLKRSRFALADTTEANMELIARWIARQGRPVALYTDWAGHFKQPQKRRCQPAQTQIQRALGELDIELITANSPQAKGRVERSHGTDQDRLVKGLRRAGARTLEEAQRYLEQEYLPQINAKFAKAPADPLDAHRSAAGYDLEAILSVQERRRVAKDWTVSIDGAAWQIEPGERTQGLQGQRVIVERRRDGSVRLRWADRYLKFHRATGSLEIEARNKRAVDMTACGQIPGAARPGICPQALENSPTSFPHAHSPDDDEEVREDLKNLRKPVRILNCTRKPSPSHPWHSRHF